MASSITISKTCLTTFQNHLASVAPVIFPLQSNLATLDPEYHDTLLSGRNLVGTEFFTIFVLAYPEIRALVYDQQFFNHVTDSFAKMIITNPNTWSNCIPNVCLFLQLLKDIVTNNLHDLLSSNVWNLKNNSNHTDRVMISVVQGWGIYISSVKVIKHAIKKMFLMQWTQIRLKLSSYSNYIHIGQCIW